MKYFILQIFLALIIISNSFSQIHIPEGNVSGTWTAAASPYIIDGKITISQNDQLTIEPGVQVEFSDNYMFKVKGRLLAIGTVADSIHFFAQDTAIGWHGLRFINTDLNSQDSSILKYCTFRYGKAISEGKAHWWYDRLGGAIYAQYSSKLSVLHSTFEFNHASYSGAIYLGHSSIRMSYLTIRNNRTFERGGAIYVDTSNLYIDNSEIYNNYSSDFGGAICYITDEVHTEIELKNVEIHHNIAGTAGGGISIHSNSPDLNFQNVDIHHNKAPHGGGISGAFNVVSCNEVNIHHNEAIWVGGGIYIFSSLNGDNISNMKIHSNICEGGGGGIYFKLCENFIVDHCLLYGNTADRGGGIIVDSSLNCEFRNTTIASNNTNWGEGGLAIYNHSSATLSGCIIAENEQDEIYVSNNSEATAQYSLISGGYPGLDVLDMDPLFTDPVNNDYSLSWEDFPDHNATKSPCIDSGDPIYIDPDGTISDMGVIPYNQTYSPLTFGDLSGTLTCAGSPYYIYGDQTVPAGEELIIEPCVFVIFQGHYKLKVDGRLLAEGTENNNISFYSADSTTGWNGIQFSNQDFNFQDSSIMKHCRVMYGNANGYGNDASGGGISFISSSDVRIENCLITKNRANEYGGGIYGNYSHPLLLNNTIAHNEALNGGGLYGYASHFIIKRGIIENNKATSGGGVYIQGNTPEFYAVTIRENLATEFGGGFFLTTTADPIFSSTERCNIYDNYAYKAGTDICGKDLYSSSLDLFVSFFTVFNPDDHFIYPIEKFNTDILWGINNQYPLDLYVSTIGDDSNGGTYPDYPLKSIRQAVLHMRPNLADTLTIHLEAGTYSPSTTGENFPINFKGNVALVGNEGETVILDGEDTTNFFYFYDDQNCFIKNIQMKNGEAEYGGAVYVENQSNPHFESISITNCTASLDGGGIYVNDDSYATFHGATFSGNAGRYGGALMCNSSNAKLYNVGFTGNTGYEGGAINTHICDYFELDFGYIFNNVANNGGACEFYRTDTVVIDKTIFEQNNAISQYGGGMYIQQSDVSIANSKFNLNWAKWFGGAIYFYLDVNLDLNNIVISNDSAARGGGIYGNYSSTLSLKNGLLHDNSADSSSLNNAYGGAMYLWDVETEIINTTITNNSAFDGTGGIYNKTGNINLINSILWADTPPEIYLESGTLNAEYSNIQDSYPGIGNLDSDPGFYNVADNDFSLQDISPCRDAGTIDTTGLFLPDRCLAGNPRIGNSRVDMGAYEYFPRLDLELSVFLEGPYNGLNMNTDLTGNPELAEQFPFSQPYDISPWLYFGDESLTSAPGPDVVDWVLVELRDAANPGVASSDKMMNSFAGLLLNDGSVVSKDGTSNLQFYDIATEQLFVTIKHRNHLGIISAFPLSESGEIYSYDFTSAAGQAYGTDAQKDLGGGVFGMFAGDADPNGIIELPDKTNFWQNESGHKGYINGDMNLDGQVNNKDKNDYWQMNINKSSQVPE